jgi:amidohydrolase
MNPPLLFSFLIVTAVLGSQARTAELPAWLDSDAKKLHPGVIALRRDIHENPELSNAEERTGRVIAERLRGLGLEVKTGVAKHGVVALLRGAKPGPCVAVRADMDALPIEEGGALPFKSKQPGVMHACGHDAHTAIALGVAELLASHRAELAGSVKFLFQPAEEGMPVRYTASWGAKLMIEEGALENPAPIAVFGLHCAPRIAATGGAQAERSLPAGMLAYSFGSAYANSDSFTIDVRGNMAHGSSPHRGIDAIMVAASMLMELQTIRSRQISSQTPMVLTVGTIKGGQRSNILADHVEMSGTVRTLDTATQDRVAALMEQIVKNTAAAQGATAELNYRKGYPTLINDAALTARALPVLQQVVGKERVVEKLPSMGAEDFAYFAQKVPGFYFNLGVASADDPDPAGAHTPDFKVDEAALLTGVRAMTALVWTTLTK